MNSTLKALAIPLALITVLGTMDVQKELALRKFNDMHPPLASVSMSNTYGGNTPIELRLDTSGSGRCIRLYSDTTPVTYREEPIAYVQELMHAKRSDISKSLNNLGITTPVKPCHP